MGNFLNSFNPIFLYGVGFVLLLVFLLGRYKFFVKIGIDGWKGLVPVYSDYLYYEKGKVNPWLSTLFIALYLFLHILSICSADVRELFAITMFFKLSIIILSMIVSWKVNYYISRKLKKGYLFAVLLTFLPIITIPCAGLCKNIKWSKLTRVKDDFLTDDFYANRKITVNEMCISNIFMVLSILAIFYIVIYLFMNILSTEVILNIIWSPYFILVLVLFLSFITLVATMIDYLFNKFYLNSRRKK